MMSREQAARVIALNGATDIEELDGGESDLDGEASD